MNTTRILALVLVLLSSSTWAQSGEWDWRIAPYLWAANISGEMSLGPIDQDIDASFSDIFSNLEIGGSIFAEFGKDKHAVHFDYTYLRVRPDPTELAFPPGAELSTKLTARFFEPAFLEI